MYLLYLEYCRSEDDVTFCPIAVSESKESLEKEMAFLEEKAKLEIANRKEWQDRFDKYLYESRNKLADWLTDNIDALMEYPIGESRVIVVRDWLGRTKKVVEKKDWAYAPHVALEKKQQFIDRIRSYGSPANGLSLDEYILPSKLKAPQSTIQPFNEPVPPYEFEYYQGHMFIEEVKVV
jgi:hypothetical protein